jgi:hypothetical protein
VAVFFHPLAGHVVKLSQQPRRAAAGPTGHLVLSMSGYPCRGWHDRSKESSVIANVISCGAISFRPRGSAQLRVLIFSRYVLLKSKLLRARFSSKSFAFFVLFGCKYRLSSGPVLRSRLEFESLESSPSWVFYMFTQKDFLALIDIVLAFESRILIPRIICYGPAVHLCSMNQRCRSSLYTTFKRVILLRSSSCES